MLCVWFNIIQGAYQSNSKILYKTSTRVSECWWPSTNRTVTQSCTALQHFCTTVLTISDTGYDFREFEILTFYSIQRRDWFEVSEGYEDHLYYS
jgi:hypothetical protein